QLLTSSPVYDRWMVAHYGGDANAAIGWQGQTGGGAKLVMDNNGGLPVDWVMGPWVIKEFSEPIAVSSDRVINWSQYDPIHALSFAAKITGTDGKARWLNYSANGQNHAGEISNGGLFGYVNMGFTQETYNQWQTFSRNVHSDYSGLFGVAANEITALGLSHFAKASWNGDNGGAVRDISFGREGHNWQTIATLLNPLATAYNNANRMAVSTSGTIHLALSGIDEILYTYSADQGRNWSLKQTVGNGQYPAIAVSSVGEPSLAWTTLWMTATSNGGVFFSQHTGGGWSVLDTIDFTAIGPWDYMGGFSPPSMTIKDGVVSMVYEYAYRIGIPPRVKVSWQLNQVRFPLSDPGNKTYVKIDSTESYPYDPWNNPTSATMATDIKGNDHIAWHRDNKVFYCIRKTDGTYGAIVQLSGSGAAANPSISVFGVASVVWEEEGDIYLRQGSDQSWEPIVNISQTSAYSAMPTVLNNEVVWSEYITDYNADIFQSQYDINKMAYSYPNNLTQTEYLSLYNHLATYKTLKYTKYYRLWTEEMRPYEAAAKAVKTYYDVLFGTDSVSNINLPLYAVDAGQVNPSIFTLQRDGYIQYAGETKSGGSILPYKTVDYDSTALIYQFDNIDTTKIVDIVLSFYHELDGELKLKPRVDDIPLGEVKVPSKQEIVLEKRLPAACYRDGLLTLRIEKHKGPIAVCGKILIYENFQGNGHGGAQSEEITSIAPNYINKLYQNRPNPFSHKTNFNYQIKKQGQVTFKVYNALGQLVKTLVNETKPAGAYQVEWDGRDGSGLKVSSGVYIYRLSATGGSALGGQTGDFRDTKKMVIIK
ncbi:MAG: FlgD immunoglobulin-like domain containing protein, partial [Nitrospirota bacterium]|nr:FlgD immunoglobulin-like domain containing protein [Nitrospirota bacterium]